MTSDQTAFGVAMVILIAFLTIGLPLIPVLEQALTRRIARTLNRPVNDNEPPEADRV